MVSPLGRLPGWAKGMLEQARVARLGFADETDHPRVLPVTFVLCDEALYSAVDRKPKRASELARIRYLSRRPRAALTVDHYEDDWDALALETVRAQGKARIPGLGHHVHKNGDPRTARLFEIAEEAISAGWAELHPVARRGLLPTTAVMVYAPRDDFEGDVVADLIRISYSFARGNWGAERP